MHSNACAEGNADIFLTTDNCLLFKALSYRNYDYIIVAQPITL